MSAAVDGCPVLRLYLCIDDVHKASIISTYEGEFCGLFIELDVVVRTEAPGIANERVCEESPPIVIIIFVKEGSIDTKFQPKRFNIAFEEVASRGTFPEMFYDVCHVMDTL